MQQVYVHETLVSSLNGSTKIKLHESVRSVSNLCSLATTLEEKVRADQDLSRTTSR